ncbi:unnamed protein product, partial [Ixodes persulcatus]
KCPLAPPLPLSFPSGVGQVALWTVFNSTMGYAAFLAFRDGGGLQGPARPFVALFAASLGYNWAWPPLFYYCKFYALAMLDITLLCGSVAMLGHVYLPINRHASKLMAPCFLWTFTTALFNYSVWRCQKHYCSF